MTTINNNITGPWTKIGEHLALIEAWVRFLPKKKTIKERRKIVIAKILEEKKYDIKVPTWNTIIDTKTSQMIAICPSESEDTGFFTTLYSALFGSSAYMGITCEFKQAMTIIKVENYNTNSNIFLKTIPY